MNDEYEFKKTVNVQEDYSPEYGPNLRFFKTSFSLKAIDLIIAASDFLEQHCAIGDSVSLELYRAGLDAFVENEDGKIVEYAMCDEWSNDTYATYTVKPKTVCPRLYVENCGTYYGEDIAIDELKAFNAANKSQGGSDNG